MLPFLSVTLFTSTTVLRCAAVSVLLTLLWLAIAWAVVLP